VSEIYAWHTDEPQTYDSLSVWYKDDTYSLDTISVGDTVRFAVLLNAVTNQLTSFSAKADAGLLDMSFLLTNEFEEALEESSDQENGLLNFKVGYSAATVPMQYVALKSGSAKVTLTLSTTSEFSPRTLSFLQPIY